MITDDEVMRILERADPARVDDDIPMIDAAGYLDVLRTSSNVTLIDTEPTSTRPSRRRWAIITAAAAAVVAIVVGGLVLAARDDADDAAAPADRPARATNVTPTTPARVVLTPLVGIRSRLGKQGVEELFRVHSDTAAYWRVATLPEFDGRMFTMPSRTLVPLDEADEAGPGGRTILQQIEIQGLEGQLLPAAADPRQVVSNAEIRFEPDTSTLVKTSPLLPGDQYSVVSAAPDVSPEMLRAASSQNPPDDVFLGLPDNLPDLVAELADEVTASATTDYDRMLALQNWFRTFDYSVDVQSGHSSNAIENFLQTRTGYCEQFAAAFAVMARTLDIPSRVAVGFTPGNLTLDGSYSVTSAQSHAWPELWFDDIGWVAFEPTPGRGAPGAEDYTGVEPAQQAAP